MKNSKLGDAVASEMESILAKDSFKMIFSSPIKEAEKSIDKDGFTDGKYKPFVRIASLDKAAIFKSLVESISEASKALDEIGLEKSATVALGLLNGMIKEAEEGIADEIEWLEEGPANAPFFDEAPKKNKREKLDEFLAKMEEELPSMSNKPKAGPMQEGLTKEQIESGIFFDDDGRAGLGEPSGGGTGGTTEKKAQVMGTPIPSQEVDSNGGKKSPQQPQMPNKIRPDKATGFGGVGPGSSVEFRIKTDNDNDFRPMTSDEGNFYKNFLIEKGFLVETPKGKEYKNLTEMMPVPKTWKALGYLVRFIPSSGKLASLKIKDKKTVDLYNKVASWVKG